MDYTGSIYRLIDRAEDEMKEYAQRVKQLSADEIYRHSAETAAKESLLSALIHDSYELDDDDLDLILKPKNPVEALYQFLTSDKTDLSSESSISSILSEYNEQMGLVIEDGNGFDTMLLEKLEQRPEAADAGKNGTSLELELDTFMEKLYKKYVPSQTREYIESMAEPEEQPHPRPARSPRSAAPDTFDEKKGVE